MSAEGPNTTWPTPVTAYLKEALPTDRKESGEVVFRDMAGSAFQQGCHALAALGQATRTAYGADPHPNPALPAVLPRWDDVCCAVLRMLHQKAELDYRNADGSVHQRPTKPGQIQFRAVGASPFPPPLAANIAPAFGGGSAWVSEARMGLLKDLGLVRNGIWTSAAEPVLWREAPTHWGLPFASDPRFFEATEDAVATLPADIAAALFDAEDPSDETILRVQARMREDAARFAAKFPASPKPDTSYQAVRASLRRRAKGQQHGIFCQNWRFHDGWLDAQERSRALDIFHDPLAHAMHSAVMARLRPQEAAQ